MRTKDEIKKLILDACSQEDCPAWLIGEIGQLLNEFENAVMADNSQDAYELLDKSLTFAETEAFKQIINRIGSQGIISIINLSKETGISRPVFNNLLNKLENTKIATIQNMGNKGTYIKIIKERNR